MGLKDIFEQAAKAMVGYPLSPAEGLAGVTDREDLLNDFEVYLEAHEIYPCDVCGTYGESGECNNGLCYACEEDCER